MNFFRLIKPDPHARPRPFTFYPPKNNRFVTAIAKMVVRRDIRRKLKVTEIEIDDDSLAKLQRLKGERCLVTPSHSGGYEPHLLLYLSKLLDVEYNFLAAIELFEQSAIQRWIIQRLGVYSIVRGTADRPSFSMTRQILTEGKRWLVIFPEGETIWQGSTLMPFQQGTLQLAFKGYEDALKANSDASLFCIPMAIKYVYLKNMKGEIEESLKRLEAKLSLSPESRPIEPYDRLRRVAEVVLAANEKAHHVQPSGESGMNERIQSLRERVVSHLEQELSVSTTTGQPMLDRVRALFNAADRMSVEESASSEYERRLSIERQQVARNLYNHLWRLLRFVAIYDGYIQEAMTAERFMDVLGLLEAEVLGKRRVWGPRKACIKVGEPVNLRDRLDSYRQDRRATVATVTMELETDVREMLKE